MMEVDPDAQFAWLMNDLHMQDAAMIGAAHAAMRWYDDEYDASAVEAARELGIVGIATEMLHELHKAGYRITKMQSTPAEAGT